MAEQTIAKIGVVKENFITESFIFNVIALTAEVEIR
jgi:hypothetical protein